MNQTLTMKKIGILGGTFDPVHMGHLMLAEQAYQQCDLDFVYFIPNKIPPHKQNQLVSSEKHRLNMLQLAVKDNPHFKISTMELERKNVSYTAETITTLTEQYPQVQWHYIVGADSFVELLHWKDPERVMKNVTFIVAIRTGYAKDELLKQQAKLLSEYKTKSILLDTPNIEISSKFIREQQALQCSIRYYVPAEVEEYIVTEGLYLGKHNYSSK